MKLTQENFRPDVIAALNSSGAAAASILAVKLGLQDIVVVSRRRIDPLDHFSLPASASRGPWNPLPNQSSMDALP